MAVVLLWAYLCRRACQAFWLERFWGTVTLIGNLQAK